jgi:hypothetical protein
VVWKIFPSAAAVKKPFGWRNLRLAFDLPRLVSHHFSNEVF